MRAAWVVLALLAVTCAHRAPGTSQAEVRNWVYADNRGLLVVTTAGGVVQPLGDHVILEAHALADHVHIAAPKGEPVTDPSHPGLTGHDHDGDGKPDALSGASVPVDPDADAVGEWRFEGAAEVTWLGAVRDTPGALSFGVRGSTEPDYASISGKVGGTLTLGDERTAVDAYVGVGHDVSSPAEPPPGQADQWPATQTRVFAGLAVDHVVDRRTRLGLGVSTSFQRGTLESPYRYALVTTTLFPEQLPDARDRFLVSATASRYLGGGVAAHLRPAFYFDSWGVLAFIPEAAVAVEMGPRALLTMRYRWYRQTPASFYEPHYHELKPILAADSRLAAIDDHVPGVALRWTATESDDGARRLVLSAGYDFSWHTWPGHDLEPLLAHMTQVGMTGAW